MTDNADSLVQVMNVYSGYVTIQFSLKTPATCQHKVNVHNC